jgi:hypothetical protein
MEPSRPIARKRLDRLLEQVLPWSSGLAQEDSFAFSDLRRKLDLIAQERRFVPVMYLLRKASSRTDYEVAEAIRDLKSNVVCNLHALVALRVVLPSRNETTGIIRYRINREVMDALSDLLRP